jgi:hypothetical protein
MGTNELIEAGMGDPEALIEQYKKEHPELEETLRIFEVSNETYEAAVKAMYGEQVSWSNAANRPAPTR